VPKRREQKGPKPAALGAQARQPVVRDDAGEKLLCAVFGFVVRSPAPGYIEGWRPNPVAQPTVRALRACSTLARPTPAGLNS